MDKGYIASNGLCMHIFRNTTKIQEDNTSKVNLVKERSKPNPGKEQSTKKAESEKGSSARKLKDELSKVKAELERTRLEKEELSRSLAAMSPRISEDFGQVRSSTMREEPANGNETLLTAMNKMTMGGLSIPECTPEAGDTELSKRAFDHWKKVLNSSMNLIQVTDESTKMDLFLIKAGPFLLEMLEGTTTQPDMPDENLFPYSNAMARLDAYFGSRAYMLAQRSKLANMVQKNGEANIEFVKRVAAASKMCNYKAEEEFEAISRTVTRGSTDSRVRTLSYRVLTDGGCLNELIDQVRIREVELANENDYRRLHQHRSATVAAISDRAVEQRRRFEPLRASSSRGRGYVTQGSGRVQKSGKACWRCLNTNHTPENCFHIDKVCRNCDHRGHLRRACPSQAKPESRKRRWTDEESEPPTKIAAVQKVESDSETKVTEEEN